MQSARDVGPSPHVVLAHPRYVAGEVLGSGGQGVVFRVEDAEQPTRLLVAKLYTPGHFAHDELRGEFALLARLRIPGLVRAHDLGRDERTAASFLVEDHVPGPDAASYVASAEVSERHGRLLHVLASMATTLTGLHDAGFLHGDLKPAHVRVPSTGRPVLLDLGSAVPHARTTAPKWLSPEFAAPEVLQGASATVASDLFGLGALGWACATLEAPPARGARTSLRTRAPWVSPHLADLVESLLAEHPADRPPTARDVLAAVGLSAGPGDLGSAPAPFGRERELAVLVAWSRAPGVRYLQGESGSGKSHLLRELAVRSLLAGQGVRPLSFPHVDPSRLAQLVAFLRGERDTIPFADARGERPLLLLLDDLHLAPPELLASLEVHRCSRRLDPGLSIVAGVRSAPSGAEVTVLEPLAETTLVALARSLGGATDLEADTAARAAQGSAGWLLATLGRVPVTADAVEIRVRTLSPDARRALGVVAVAGGSARTAWIAAVLGEATGRATTELLGACLVGRRVERGGARLELSAPAARAELARSLVGFDVVDTLAAALLDDASPPASSLLAVARADSPPARRDELLRRAADVARAQMLRTEEIEALLALAADARHRDAQLLCRLERLSRDAGTSASHPQVLAWLSEAAERDPGLHPLSLRRLAEAAARRGDHEEATRLAEASLRAARGLGDAGAEALAGAALGLVHLYRAEWAPALARFRVARAAALSARLDDAEELARLDHNLGVVAVYRGSLDEALGAFERALSVKQRLGDRAGVRACLRNLGYALTRLGRHDEAARALDDALSLAVSLGQSAGRAWCLAARAEVELRRGSSRSAERLVAEGELLGDAVPPAIRGDLTLLRAEIALLEGDATRALTALARVDASLRAGDAFVDARAHALAARAHLALVPSRRRDSARSAIAALRRARAADLPEPAALALSALREARAPERRAVAAPVGYAPCMSAPEERAWGWLARVSAGATRDESVSELLAMLVGDAAAERAFLAVVEPDGAVVRAAGVDLDGMSIGDAERRLPRDLVLPALGSATAVYRRSVTTVGGDGARLAIASSGEGTRAVLVLEHRFAPGRFDALDPALLGRYATLAALTIRLSGEGALRRAPDVATPAPAAKRERPPLDVTTLHPLDRPRRPFPTIRGTSPALERALCRLDAAIDGDLPVLVLGETGVGKELFARALHDHGSRATGPFVAVNCASIPDNLFEAELFGHARGAFTGAERARIGLFASAQLGTLFLDEIGELSLPRQASLLRVLESQRYRPVGSDEEKISRVRIVAATHRDLEQRVASGTFRQDLLFRLNVLTLRVPPLRERPEDILLLARRFLESAGSKATLGRRAELALSAHAWPGNVRELAHVMARLATLPVERIELAHLPRELRGAAAVMTGATPVSEAEDVTRALESAGGNISHAARALGITRHGLKKRMVRLGMRAKPAASRGDDDDA